MIKPWKSSTARPSEPAAPAPAPPPFPGIPEAMDGSSAIVAMETAASEAAGAYPITPSTQMGEGWAAAVAEGKRNVNGRRLLFFEPEGEHAAAAVTAGMSMTGLRSANFSSGQGIAYMHESLYAAVGKRLTYVLNVAARAITKHALNVHAGHDDYHAVDDTGFFQLFARDVQEAADLNLVAHRIAELALNPGIIAQDGFLTSHVIETMRLPEPALIKHYLGDPSDLIDSPTPAQRLVFGPQRRRIPELYDVDYPAMLGTVQNQDSYAQGIAAQRPFYFDHIAPLADQAFREFASLTGRSYARASGYRLDDAEYAIVGQGSVVSNAEAVADWFREQGVKVGVLNLTMFRPFPADCVAALLQGKRGVVVLERTDQPLAVDPPLLRELRAALSKAVENHRASGPVPHAGIPAVHPEQVPDFYSGCFGLGSRDLQPADIIAAVDNMRPTGTHRRQFYLGIDFIRPDTRLPKLQLWQQELTDGYPHLGELTLPVGPDVHLMPKGAVSLRIHSVGGWGAITMGKNLSMTVFELLGMQVKANPKYGSEKKGQPTTFYATFAREAIRLNCELRHVDVVLSPDPNVFRHSDPLAGLAAEGVFVIQSDHSPEELWRSLPATARRTIREKKLRIFALDAFAIAAAEASDPELRYRMQGAAFMGAFFAVSPLMQRERLEEQALFDGIRDQLVKKFGKKGESVVEDNVRVIRRGYDELREVTPVALDDATAIAGEVPHIPARLDVENAEPGVGNPGRFWEQVCTVCKMGQDPIADPFAALSAMPAATSAVRDMTLVRMEVPKFIPERCTGCGQCWTQCPDAAIPGLVSEPEDLIAAAMQVAGTKLPITTLRPVGKSLAKEARRFLTESGTFAAAVRQAWPALTTKLGWDAAKVAAATPELDAVHQALAAFPLARTAPFFDMPERKAKGTGGLLSIVVNPEACKGCNLCVAVCPDGALTAVKQDDAVIARMKTEWNFWQQLPDTPDRFINVSDIEHGIGVLPSLLLKKSTYGAMAGGDGACMGCGEKTAVHLIVDTIHAVMGSRVDKQVAKIDGLIEALEGKARGLLASDTDLAQVMGGPDAPIAVQAPAEHRQAVERYVRAARELRDLRWRYTDGPGGQGRAKMAMANSTGCSSVWASTYPYNPYPFPWANHLFQDSPSLAIGAFEGHMRKMATGFAAVRRAEQLVADEYDAEKSEPLLQDLDWQAFTDEEFALCPPIVAMGGDGAMLDIGFQNLSRLLASNKPIRVVVLDTQVYSNTGGQACTSGFTGQVSDMATWGTTQHGKTESRKELALIAMAHRGAFVHQTSQASPSHLMAGVIHALGIRRPALINVYTPCPVEHGLADDWAQHAAKLALESRAFPFLTYDPDAGSSVSECLTLEGNPSLEDEWPTYTLEYLDGAEARTMELPLTTADWAATEGRFKKHFKPAKRAAWTDAMVPFHEYLALGAEEREGKVPFIHTVDRERQLSRLTVSLEIVRLAEERQRFWAQLREMAGVKVPEAVRERVAAELQQELESRMQALRTDYEARMAELRATYPATVARRLAEGLLRAGAAGQSLTDFLGSLPPAAPELLAAAGAAATHTNGGSVAAPAATPTSAVTEVAASAFASVPAQAAAAVAAPAASAAPAPAAAAADDDAAVIEPWIESERCTTCNECINTNRKMFAYNKDKQAFVKDAAAGTFQQLVLAAEKCPVGAIHPGTPLNPNEKDLAKWVERARPF
ncbi:MAG: 2-oxoacid:acceptor oxidoreductase family protein [Gemmatimonadaceae bacterium]